MSSGVQPEEIDLIFPAIEDEENDFKIHLDQFHNIMHVFDWRWQQQQQ